MVGTTLCVHFSGGTLAHPPRHVAGGMDGCGRGEWHGGLGRGASIPGYGGCVGNHVGMFSMYLAGYAEQLVDDERLQCCASAYLSYFFMDCMMSRWCVYSSHLSEDTI